MLKCFGKSVLEGIAAGKIHIFRKKGADAEKKEINNPDAEIGRFDEARVRADRQLAALYEKTEKEIGKEEAMIFEVHRMMLADEDYQDTVRRMILREKVNAEYAVLEAGKAYAQEFASMEDDYMKARGADVLDVSRRVAGILSGTGSQESSFDEPVILLAEDLSPSETMQLDKSKIAAFVLRGGSANSHTAILARAMNVPALVQTQTELKDEYEGRNGAVDGFKGMFILEPDEETEKELQDKINAAVLEGERLRQLKGLENVTSDGRKINICANIGSAEDVESVLSSDAEGIGLFRSEFIYLGREDYPSEEEQFEIYRNVLSNMKGKPVIIRTLDIGADKQAGYFKLDEEENPALGYRAIRICLTRTEIFKTQLRAILRAAAYGNAGIMFPMIASLWEIRKAKEITEEVKKELAAEGRAFGQAPLGIMIETPAAAIISDRLAEEVAFFSIGTNDLTQYTLAVDRQNQTLEKFYDAHHEAVLRLIGMTVENAHKAGIWAGICGELAADTSLTKTFVDMGVDELSVSPSMVLKVRKAVREI